MRVSIVLHLLLVILVASWPALGDGEDLRDITTGHRIPDEGYCDQPYVVVLRDGTWLCTLTTGPGREGQGGQHVVSTISTDRGRTWSPPVDIEPADGPQASWVVPLVTPAGRVYVFYTYNGARVDALPDGRRMRADTHGWYAMRYSDDGGRTWSDRRYRLPMRVTACDRSNDFGGDVQMFWGIDKPKISGDRVYFAFTKIGRYFLEDSEGWLYVSDNLLTEPDVASIHWELRPAGERGIRHPPFGSVQEEHNMVPLAGDALYCVYRTKQGHPCHAYSADGGRTWSTPEPMTYTPGGRIIKQPRACPKLWRCENGKLLFWFHLNGGRSFDGRNPAWISGGVIRDGDVHWSEPEILLYDRDPGIRMSYPDLIEDAGRYWVTETQKAIARVHEIDPTLLEGLWRQGEDRAVTRRGLLGETTGGAVAARIDLTSLSGVTLECWIRQDELGAVKELLTSRGQADQGVSLVTVEGGAVRLSVDDGENSATWTSDNGLLTVGVRHHIVAILDVAPRIITFVIDGKLGDGGAARPVGWGRWKGDLGDVSGDGRIRAGASALRARVYDRYLRTSEAIANFHAGP